MPQSLAHIAAATINHIFPDIQPKVGIILGSGLGSFIECLSEVRSIPYQDIPHFPCVGVKGHNGVLTMGTLGNRPVICLQGRSHTYEGQGFEWVKTYVRTLHCLGCEYFITTNAAGSLHTDMQPGELMVFSDHINLQGLNPLVGANEDGFGPRFIPLDNAYDKQLREHFLQVAARESIHLHQGVYICVTGPNFETPAEIRAFKTLGADAVGMSTVPEVLVATHCGMRTVAISAITNFGTGLASCSHSHDEVLNVANQAAQSLKRLLLAAVPCLP